MRANKPIFWLIGIGVVLFAVMQLIPYGRDHSNPPVAVEPRWNNASTRDLAARACFDCHSNETVWPWYSQVAPASWLVQKDVNEARMVMNFSDWENYGLSFRMLERVIQSGEMPPAQYTLLHPEAVLSAEEKKLLLEGLQKTLQE